MIIICIITVIVVSFGNFMASNADSKTIMETMNPQPANELLNFNGPMNPRPQLSSKSMLTQALERAGILAPKKKMVFY